MRTLTERFNSSSMTRTTWYRTDLCGLMLVLSTTLSDGTGSTDHSQVLRTRTKNRRLAACRLAFVRFRICPAVAYSSLCSPDNFNRWWTIYLYLVQLGTLSYKHIWCQYLASTDEKKILLLLKYKVNYQSTTIRTRAACHKNFGHGRGLIMEAENFPSHLVWSPYLICLLFLMTCHRM